MRFLILLIPLSASADPAVNVVAHVGGSYMIDSILYNINKTYTSKANSEILSSFETLLLGVAYKASEHFPKNTSNSLLEDSVGLSLSVGIRYEF